MQKIEIKKEDLIEYYVNRGLSTSKVGDILKCSNATISKYLKEYNIPTRPMEVAQAKRKLPEKELSEKGKKISKALTGKFKGENNPMYGKHLTEENKKNISLGHLGKVLTKDMLENLYILQDLTIRECSKKLGCSEPTIKKYLKIFNIPIKIIIKDFSKELLEDLYSNQKLSSERCAKILNCVPSTINCYLNKYSISIRSGSEAQKYAPPITDEGRKNLSIACMGEKNGFYGKAHSEESKKKQSIIKLGKKDSDETRKKRSESWKKLWADPEFKKKKLMEMNSNQNITPNKPESFLLELLNWLYPGEWEFVGNYSLIINGKNPDFVNRKTKQIIEHFGQYWHRDDDPIKRMEIFAKEGWETLIIWENELQNSDELIYKIEKFCGSSIIYGK